MNPDSPQSIGQDLSERERRVLEAVVRTYVDFAEPAGSRTLAKRFDLGVSPATVRNTMSDLETKGYLFHRHTSAGLFQQTTRIGSTWTGSCARNR